MMPETCLTILIGLALWMAAGLLTLVILVHATGIRYTKCDMCWCAGLGPIGLIPIVIIELTLKAYGGYKNKRGWQ